MQYNPRNNWTTAAKPTASSNALMAGMGYTYNTASDLQQRV
jgi:hypothetical protein